MCDAAEDEGAKGVSQQDICKSVNHIELQERVRFLEEQIQKARVNYKINHVEHAERHFLSLFVSLMFLLFNAILRYILCDGVFLFV